MKLISILSVLMLLTASSACRTSEDESELIEAEPFSPFAMEEGECPDEYTQDHYFIRPFDAEFPYYEIDVCMDSKFKFHSSAVTVHESKGKTSIPGEQQRLEIATEYTQGIFETITITRGNEQTTLTRNYPEDSLAGPLQFVPVYHVTTQRTDEEGETDPISYYQSNLEDKCPREWFIAEDANRLYQSKDREVKIKMNVCQLNASEETVFSLPLTLEFTRLPAKLSKTFKPVYGLNELVSQSTHRNFSNAIVIGGTGVFRDQDPNHQAGEPGLQPGLKRDHFFEALTEDCDRIDTMLDCKTNPSWQFQMFRDCPASPPKGACTTGQMQDEYYCHSGTWRCRYLQQSKLTYEPLPDAAKGQACDLGDSYGYFPKCEDGLTCDIDGETGESVCR